MADRFHLVKNAGEALQRVLQRHPAALRAAAQAHADVTQPALPTTLPAVIGLHGVPAVAAPRQSSADREQRFRRVLELHAQGLEHPADRPRGSPEPAHRQGYILARELPKRGGPVDPMTSSVTALSGLRRAALARGLPERAVNSSGKSRRQGYRGSYSSMCRALKHLRQGDGRRTARPPTTPRSAAGVLAAAGHVAVGAARGRPGRSRARRAADAAGRECGDCHGRRADAALWPVRARAHGGGARSVVGSGDDERGGRIQVLCEQPAAGLRRRAGGAGNELGRTASSKARSTD